MKKLNYKIAFFAVFMMLSTLGCKDLDLIPEDNFTDLNYWSTEARAQGVLNTAYSQLFNSNYFFYNEALSDNAVNARGDNAGATSIATGSYDASLGRFQEEWSNHYAGIKTTNILIENIDRIEDIDEDVRADMEGQARFIRAFLHFQLMTWFGPIPLLDSDLTIEEAQTIRRTSRETIVQFIVSELDAITESMPSNTEISDGEKGRITSGAVVAFKARVLLYEGKWEEAAAACESIINGNHGSYALFSSYEGLFKSENEYSSEDILSLQYVPQFRMWNQMFDMAPLSAGARLNALAPTQELVDSYSMLNGRGINEANSGYDENDPYANRDPRLTHTVVYHGYQWESEEGGNRTIYIAPGTDPDNAALDEYAAGSSTSATGYYVRKYYDPGHLPQMNSGLNLMLIRYADVLLMYAEAKNELTKIEEGDWSMTIGALRARAGFTDANALNYDGTLNQDQLREEIRNERRVELAMEGLRIFDIRRWGIAEEVLNGWATGARFGPLSVNDGYLRVQERVFDPAVHYEWPIPRDERNLNPNLLETPL